MMRIRLQGSLRHPEMMMQEALGQVRPTSTFQQEFYELGT